MMSDHRFGLGALGSSGLSAVAVDVEDIVLLVLLLEQALKERDRGCDMRKLKLLV